MEINNRAVIIDNGTRTCKVGLAGDDSPRLSSPTVVGYPKNFQTDGASEWCIGMEAKAKQSLLTLRYPIERSAIKDWELMSKIWRTLYKNILVDCTEHPLLVTYSPSESKESVKKMMEVMFERYRVPFLCMAIPAVLSLIACGRRTGIVLECGEGSTCAVPIYEGYIISPGIRRMALAGEDVTRHLMALLTEKYFGTRITDMYDVCTGIKENLCFVCSDYNSEICSPSNNLKSNYLCPDGRVITVDKERFISSECLFKPGLINLETVGIHNMAYESIKKSDIDLRRALCANVIMSGGTSLLPGILKRMKKEIETLSPPATDVRVTSPPDSALSAWIGGSVLASLDTFKQMCISRKDYEDSGPNVGYRRWL